MDFQFNLESPVTRGMFIESLTREIASGPLHNIVVMIDTDTGAEAQIDSVHSLVIVMSSIDVRGDRVFFFGYFNNEGSGIRLHELAKYVLGQNGEQGI